MYLCGVIPPLRSPESSPMPARSSQSAQESKHRKSAQRIRCSPGSEPDAVRPQTSGSGAGSLFHAEGPSTSPKPQENGVNSNIASSPGSSHPGPQGPANRHGRSCAEGSRCRPFPGLAKPSGIALTKPAQNTPRLSPKTCFGGPSQLQVGASAKGALEPAQVYFSPYFKYLERCEEGVILGSIRCPKPVDNHRENQVWILNTLPWLPNRPRSFGADQPALGRAVNKSLPRTGLSTSLPQLQTALRSTQVTTCKQLRDANRAVIHN